MSATEQVAETLDGHAFVISGVCACGEDVGLHYREHIAEALEPLIAERERVAADERDRLLRWKEEAMAVMEGLQDLGRALDLPLGSQITGPDALEAVRTLVNRLAAAEGAPEQVAGLLRGVAEEALDSRLDRVTWRAAMLAAARVVEEDARTRGITDEKP